MGKVSNSAIKNWQNSEPENLLEQRKLSPDPFTTKMEIHFFGYRAYRYICQKKLNQEHG